MFQITRENCAVIINVGLAVGNFPFSFRCSDEWIAKMLYIFLREQLEKRVRLVREEEYQAGLKDARLKKDDRRDWYSTSLELGSKK